MSSIKVLFVFAAFVVALQADDYKEKDFAMFKECADANGLKMEGMKRGERPTEPMSTEMLCTLKCTLEKQGLLSGGKINIEEARKNHELIEHVGADEVDAAMECVKGVEVSDCSDIKKIMDCNHYNHMQN